MNKAKVFYIIFTKCIFLLGLYNYDANKMLLLTIEFRSVCSRQ